MTLQNFSAWQRNSKTNSRTNSSKQIFLYFPVCSWQNFPSCFVCYHLFSPCTTCRSGFCFMMRKKRRIGTQVGMRKRQDHTRSNPRWRWSCLWLGSFSTYWQPPIDMVYHTSSHMCSWEFWKLCCPAFFGQRWHLERPTHSEQLLKTSKPRFSDMFWPIQDFRFFFLSSLQIHIYHILQNLFQKCLQQNFLPYVLFGSALGARAQCPNLKHFAMDDGWLLGVPGTQRGRGTLLEGLWPSGSKSFGRDLSKSRSRRARLCHLFTIEDAILLCFGWGSARENCS